MDDLTHHRDKKQRGFLAAALALSCGVFLPVCGCKSSQPTILTATAAPTLSRLPPPLSHPHDEFQLVSHQAPVEPPLPEGLAPPHSAPQDRPATRPIDLTSVLAVVDSDNPTVNVARQRVAEAYAQWDRAEALWLPSLRAGVNYNKHDGRIQDVLGSNVETSRGAFYSGLGASAVGAASPAIPGLYANFHLADAIFQPKIAGHAAAAREANAQATTNDFLLQAAQAYFELLRSAQDLAIAREVQGRAKALADLTEAYAKSGAGLASDFDRAQTELALRENELLRSEEALRTASARLAQLLSLDPGVQLAPQESGVVAIELIDQSIPAAALVAQALSTRPEVAEHQALVCEAVRRLEREKYAPLVPSILLGVSYGEFGAGLGGNIDSMADRFDADAVAWWELRNLGHGEAAARREMQARLSQARLRQVAALDLVAREVVEAHAQVELRARQIETARRAVEIARSSYEKNLDRIRNAEGLPLEALQAIQALAQAQREYLRTVIDFNVAQFSLQRAIGEPVR